MNINNKLDDHKIHMNSAVVGTSLTTELDELKRHYGNYFGVAKIKKNVNFFKC